jgi:DNA-binding FadR family transcriptional regulator
MYVEGWNVHRVVRPSRLANAVVERLLLRILDGEFQAGGDLPPEAALAQEFAVSRTILREALKALEEKRVLRIRHGRGTTVRPKADWNILDPLVLSVLLEYGGSPTLAADLDEVRTALQLLMADLASQRITAEQRDRLDAAHALMSATLPDGSNAGDLGAYREAVHQFARVLADASGNEVARCVVETIDVPGVEGNDTLAAVGQTHEFAERLYTRVVHGHEAVRHVEGASGAAAAQPLAAAGIALPSQPPALGAPLRRRPGDSRTTMVGAGTSGRPAL